jgi:4-hydroxy-2-oxoheptanedioate aldolase
MMDIKKRDFLLAGAALGAGLAATGAKAAVNQQPSSVDPNYKPRRLNKVIELWEDGQPIYYTGWGVRHDVDPYEQGIKMAGTWADAINIEMEHGLFSMRDIRDFMRGLRDGGPTASGHKFPATFVSTPIIGLDEAYARANTWICEQLLGCGIMGLNIVHARDAKAIATYLYMGCRYPFQDRPGVPKMPMQGLRGNSASYAADIWGVSGGTYQHLADLWPLNKSGELFIGVKLEDTYSDEAAPEITALPGLAFAEWGPGDHNLWLNGFNAVAEGGPSGHPVIRDASGKVLQDVSALPNMVAVRQNILDLCKKNGVKFLNAAETAPGHNNIIQQIKDGTMMVAAGRDGDKVAEMGREYTKRKMPV